jgi:hypothetical protein
MRPQRIRILGKPWRVEWRERIEEDGMPCYGLTTADRQLIEIEDGMVLETEQEVLIHELLHATMESMGIDDQDEKLVTQLAKGLLAVIKDNASLITYLRARKR